MEVWDCPIGCLSSFSLVIILTLLTHPLFKQEIRNYDAINMDIYLGPFFFILYLKFAFKPTQ